MTDIQIALDPTTQLITIHSRHHHITDHSIRTVILQNLHGLHTIFSRQYLLETLFQRIVQELSNRLLIIHHQDGIVIFLLIRGYQLQFLSSGLFQELWLFDRFLFYLGQWSLSYHLLLY